MTPTFTAMASWGSPSSSGYFRSTPRMAVPEIKIISNPDDYFAVFLMTVFFGVGMVDMWMGFGVKMAAFYLWTFF